MTYVITHGCCNDSSCIPVCPVQCIRPRPGDPDFLTTEQLYVDPAICIDCGACQDACPVSAIYSEWDLPDNLSDYLELNAAYFETNPIVESTPPDPVRRKLPASRPALSVAIVGTGPAGAYAAAELSEMAGVTVSLFERLPTPFGLIRAGVAPDHANTKLIAKRFEAILKRPNVRCFFNVEVGRDISIDELLDFHHAVIWAGGASDDRRLDIPGEDLAGCVSAREFVAWYNGHPDQASRTFDLTGKRAVVIGNGNVALDVARVLAQPLENLQRTEIADHALDALAASAIREVVVTARRGPEHAAYTTGELSGLAHTDGLAVAARPAEVSAMETGARAGAILHQAAERQCDEEERRVVLRFGMTPVTIHGDEAVSGITFRHADGSEETLDTELVIRAIGYRGEPVNALPYDHVTGTLCHFSGTVTDPKTGEAVQGVYVTGWIKRGATGMIGTNKTDSAETVDSLLHDFAAGRLIDPSNDPEKLDAVVRDRCPDMVDHAGWVRIDQMERQQGRAERRPRRKLVTVDALLAVARRDS